MMSDKDIELLIRTEMLQIADRIVDFADRIDNFAEKVDQLISAITTGFKLIATAPVSIFGIGATSYMFWVGKINEYSWILCFLILISPFYDIKMILGLLHRNGKPAATQTKAG